MIVGTYLPALIMGMGMGVSLPAVPALASSFGVDFNVASAVVTVFLIGNLLATLPAGRLVDRLGVRAMLRTGALLACAAATATVFARSFPELLAYRFLSGAGAQVWLVARLAGISREAPPDQRGRQVSWMFGMDNTGKVAGPLAGGLLASGTSPRAPFVVFAVLACLALLFTLSASPRTVHDSSAPQKPDRFTWRGMTRGKSGLLLLALFAGLTRGPVQADLLHLYVAFAYGVGPRGIGVLATTAAVISLPVGFIAGWAMDRFGRRTTMVPGFIGVFLAMVALAAVAGLGSPLPWFIAGFLAGTLSTALTGGSIQTVGADIAPATHRGSFLGLWRLVGQSGVTASPLLFVAVAGAVGYAWSFVLVAGCALVVTGLILRYVRPS